MTREEAIKQLLDAEHCLAGHGDLWDEDMEAFEMAIKALQAESCEDAVSRKAINELFNSEIKMYEGRIEARKGSNYHDETERIKEFRSRIANIQHWQYKIKDLPPVKPTQRFLIRR